MEICGELWISIDINEFPWVSIGIHGYPVASIDICGYPLIFMDINWYHLICMDIHGCPWISLDFHGQQWISIDIHGGSCISRYPSLASYSLVSVDVQKRSAVSLVSSSNKPNKIDTATWIHALKGCSPCTAWTHTHTKPSHIRWHDACGYLFILNVGVGWRTWRWVGWDGEGGVTGSIEPKHNAGHSL